MTAPPFSRSPSPPNVPPKIDSWDIDGVQFGKHVRSLRRRRELTQEELATRGRLSADTIRRMEGGGISPSLNTLLGVARGLELRLSTILVGCEVGMVPVEREIGDLLVGRSEEELAVILKVVRVLCED